jgi:hypothetical protein
MSLVAKWIRRQEEQRAFVHAPFKQDHAFSWGLEHLGLPSTSGDPRCAIADYTENALADSIQYFVPAPLPRDAYRLDGRDLSFPSTISTFDPVNNTAHCRYFPCPGSRNVVLAIPQWNNAGSSYDHLCRFLNHLGHSAIWMSLPFHDRRGGTSRAGGDDGHQLRSTLMVSADIGLTLRSMQQAVQDAISTVTWLQYQGYERIGLLGASIGSCTAFLAAAHDSRIMGLLANLMSSYFGEVVWAGISTRHVQRSVAPHVDLKSLRSLWLLNSPIAFVPALVRNNPELVQRYVSGRYDSTFPFFLTEKMMEALQDHGVRFEHRVLSCGHYTLGAYWFRYIDASYIWSFFRKLFR